MLIIRTNIPEAGTMFLWKQYFQILFIPLLLLNCDVKMQAISPVEIDPEIHQITKTPWTHHDLAWSPDGTQLACSRSVLSTELGYFDLEGTRQGSYASLKYHTIAGRISVSADGQKMVFRSGTLGGIWIYSTLDESTRPLTPDAFYAKEPALSPDGNWVAYIYENRLLTINIENGTPDTLYYSQYGQVSWPAWSPDGNWVAFQIMDYEFGVHSQIYKISLINKSLIKLTAGSEQYYYPDWSPDGKNIIAFSADDDGAATIWAVSADGSETSQLLNFNVSELWFATLAIPKWSPDGTKIAIGTRYAFWIYELTTDHLSFVEYLNALDYINYEWFSPQWMPDGNALIGGTPSLEGSETSEVAVINLQSLETKVLPYDAARYPGWDKFRKRMFFTTGNQLVELDLETNRLFRLDTSSSSLYLKVSPNGEWLSFNYSAEIIVRKIVDGNEKTLIRNYKTNFYLEPDWSPDARKFVCHSYDSLYIFQINPDSLFLKPNPRKLVTFPGLFYSPSWSSVHPVWGSRIAASKYESGEYTIYLIDPETLEMKPILENATSPCWAPDGCTLAYVRANGQVYTKQVLVDLSGATN